MENKQLYRRNSNLNFFFFVKIYFCTIILFFEMGEWEAVPTSPRYVAADNRHRDRKNNLFLSALLCTYMSQSNSLKSPNLAKRTVQISLSFCYCKKKGMSINPFLNNKKAVQMFQSCLQLTFLWTIAYFH